MSLLLMVLYWTVIPGLVLAGALPLWRRADTWLARAVVIGGSASILLGLLWLGVGRTMYYDWQVRELCARDGGVKVYETVTLPAVLASKYVNKITITPYSELKDTDDYYMDWRITYIRLGNPSLERNHFRLIRRSDQKLLGESVTYSRGGGDLPGPWHGTSFQCPETSKGQSLASSIFANGDNK